MGTSASCLHGAHPLNGICTTIRRSRVLNPSREKTCGCKGNCREPTLSLLPSQSKRRGKLVWISRVTSNLFIIEREGTRNIKISKTNKKDISNRTLNKNLSFSKLHDGRVSMKMVGMDLATDLSLFPGRGFSVLPRQSQLNTHKEIAEPTGLKAYSFR